MTRRREITGTAVLLVGVGLLLLFRILVGRQITPEGFVELGFGLPDPSVLAIRIGASVAAIAAGSALALSGLAFQVLLRNPLASPWVLGVSSGAGFGLMLAAWMVVAGGGLAWLGSVLMHWSGLPAAGGGALLAIVVVWLLGRRIGTFDPVTLVLCGVIVSATFAAGIMLLQHLVPNGVRGDLVTWMMGRIPEVASPWLLGAVCGLSVAGLVLGSWHARGLDVACLGEDEARSTGVSLDRLRNGLLVAGGLLAAGSVVLVGPIAFVGLLSPHVARLLVGPRHGRLVPATVAAGAAVLLGADFVRQLVDLGGGRLPVGVVTSLVGGPAFLWLLLRREARS